MSAILDLKLSSVRRRHAMVLAARGLCAIVALALILLAISMLLDYFLDLPRFARAALLSLNLGALTYLLLWQVASPIFFSPDDEELALMVERDIPDFRTRLIASVQLANPEAVPAGASPLLVQAMIRQTEELAEPIDFARVVRTHALIRTAVLSGSILLLAVSCFALARNAAPDLLKRAFLSNVPVPRDTRVFTITGDKIIAIGDAVTLLASAEGVVPPAGQVQIDYASGRRQTFSMDPVKEQPSHFSRTIENVQETFSYTVRLHDGRGERHTITAVPRPAVASIELVQKFPKYTRRAAQPRSAGDLSLLAGSELQLKIKSSKPVAQGRIQLVGLDRHAPLRVSGRDMDELTGAFQIPAKSLTGFSIRLTDEHGIASKSDTVFPIDIVPDKPPVVRITWPDRKEELATQQAKLLFAFEATDDFGLGRILIRYRIDQQATADTVARGAEKAIELDVAGLPMEELRHLRRRHEFDLATIKPPLGAVVEYWLEVMDGNDVTGPGRASSDRYRARVVTELEKRTDLMNRLNDQLGTIDAVTQDQEKLNENLGGLILEKRD